MEANASPVLSEIQAYKAPEIVDTPFASTEALFSDLNKDKWKLVENGAVDMGDMVDVSGFTYTPPLNKEPGTFVYRYNFYTSTDGANWNKIISNQTFGNIKNNPVKQKVLFDKKHKARYFKLETLAQVDGNTKAASLSELGIILKK